MTRFRFPSCFAILLSCVLAACSHAATTQPSDCIAPLKIAGENFVDPAGNPVRFWGVNLVSLYPDHAKADAIAANLAALEINLVRPHHNLRPSRDWNPKMTSGALLSYNQTSREIDPDALDRFDYLNAALRKNGIYLALSVNWTRRYLPGDVEILKTSDDDARAWSAAMTELNGWGWQKSFDVYKMLPVVDERVAQLNEEFIRTILTHVNPHTGASYASDPQVLMLEVMNEFSTEYAVVCGNRFPEYWDRQLQARWHAFANAAGVAEAGDLYKPTDAKLRTLRAAFLRKLDQDYFDRIKRVVRSTGCQAAMEFSNLWRGDNALAMHAASADVIENHAYMDPLVVRGASDGINDLAKSALADKPFFVGELNQAEGADAIRKQSPFRAMLPLAASAYGSLQNWSGIVFFAWAHGDSLIGADGWASSEGRASNIGQMVADGMQIDHLRTAGMIFRRGLVAKSAEPITLTVDEPYTAGNYNELMRGKYAIKPGWQDVHAVRKSFATTAPTTQASAAWLTQSPANPIVSDTKQIVKDIERQQLTVSAPKVEAFSGTLDANPPAGLKNLHVSGEGFATVIAVASDGADWDESAHLIISRTNINKSHEEIDGPTIRVGGIKSPGEGHWQMRATRPRASSTAEWQPVSIAPDGSIELPASSWHECELQLK